MATSTLQRPTIDELDRPVTTRIGRLARRLRHAFDESLEPYGLTGVQMGLLSRLQRADGLVQADLGRRMAIEPATLTGILQRLEREGWLRRSCDPDNRRLQRVWLTDKAREAVPALEREQSRHRRRALAGLNAAELAQLEQLLDRIEVNLG
ncbi:MAG TPA: MarR family transcriptional regulator [Dehalococcoidia bacterium]|nr:MarR family transcriptional regulator [Dehalococcoidia bacterium]